MSPLDHSRKGPLAGMKIVEFAGIGPAPMCAMLLADLGATVVRIERREAVELGTKRPLRYDILLRGRQTLALDLKDASGAAAALAIVSDADVLIEGFRPGVMERLGLGPDVCLAKNGRLVYGRLTGWGQDGPLAAAAGHDLNYIAITGALDAIGRKGTPPAVPLNIVGDFGGGALYLALGVLAALSCARTTGSGQVVDASVVDGTLSLMAMHYGSLAAGLWKPERGTNVIDSGAPFYDVYECADGKWVCVAPIEQRFFRELLQRLGIEEGQFPDHLDRSSWPRLRESLSAAFKKRARAEWCDILEGTDACFAPVLSMAEVPSHPHVAHRRGLVEVDGVLQPAPAPRFSRTPGEISSPPKTTSRDEALSVLEQWFGAERYAGLEARGLLGAVHGTQ